MSSYDSLYKKLASSLEQCGAGPMHDPIRNFDSARQISPTVAHELNNILTIIQGYSDRLLQKHGENPALEPHLKLISDAAHRASLIVRESSPPDTKLTNLPVTEPPPQPTA